MIICSVGWNAPRKKTVMGPPALMHFEMLPSTPIDELTRMVYPGFQGHYHGGSFSPAPQRTHSIYVASRQVPQGAFDKRRFPVNACPFRQNLYRLAERGKASQPLAKCFGRCLANIIPAMAATLKKRKMRFSHSTGPVELAPRRPRCTVPVRFC